MHEQQIYVNGIDGATGRYLVEPLSLSDAIAAARSKPSATGQAGQLERLRGVLHSPFMGLPRGIDPTDVTRSGWGIVFARDCSDDVRRALEPLIAHRRGQVPA